MTAFTPPPTLNTAVLFLVFNRPDATSRVFAAIRQAKPPRIYVAADGPRHGREGEDEKCEQVRRIVTAVDWQCEVKTLFRDKNLGCKYAVSSAITWFFEQEEQGIILEDDCLPHPDFFWFCQELLTRYVDDDRVMAITGDNFQNGQKRGTASYYFSRFNHVWGWASWRRAWHHYDAELSFWPFWRETRDWQTYWPDSVAQRYWQDTFDRVARGEIDTWDYQWTAAVWRNGGLTATPNVNLVSNIGFGPESTHTASADSPLAEMETQSLGGIFHPAQVCQDEEADRYVFDHTFGGKHYRLPWSLIRLPRQVGGFVYRRMKQVFA